MTLESRVCSPELAKRLNELGVKQESLFYYAHQGELEYVENYRKNWEESKDDPCCEPCTFEYYLSQVNGGNIYSAFTASELGEMLPIGSETFKTNPQLAVHENGKWQSNVYVGTHTQRVREFADTEADVRAKTLITLIEQKLYVP